MAGDPLNYQQMTEEALRGVVRQALAVASERGLPGQHHFYLTFRTAHPGVRLADHLRQRHPDEMTIVLQHQFWGLEIGRDEFSVTLSFNGQHERLTIPFAAISAFVDPSVQFGLQFSVTETANVSAPAAPVAALPPKPSAAPAATPAAAEAPASDGGDRVVALDAFRKSDGRKK